MTCCEPRGCDEFFSARFARRVARRYRKRGLDRVAEQMVGFLERAGVEGATVLEVGGGVGEIHLELLKRGARSAVNLELSPAYDAEAVKLLREAGLEGRVDRRLHDIAADPDGVEGADIVVLHRVVCCYPDYARLLGAAAAHARRLLVFSHPRRNAATRLFVAGENAVLAMRSQRFRTFAHRPSAMLDVCRADGMAPGFAWSGLTWQAQGLERASA